ncbi:hypothetical protein F5Y15DRAFT_364789 [Xylariaceae sp. FL0016]|nr:hypothetical protein F5Y15DRAFT_364789 [Xylariaceae sp. FL0016]
MNTFLILSSFSLPHGSSWRGCHQPYHEYMTMPLIIRRLHSQACYANSSTPVPSLRYCCLPRILWVPTNLTGEGICQRVASMQVFETINKDDRHAHHTKPHELSSEVEVWGSHHQRDFSEDDSGWDADRSERLSSGSALPDVHSAATRRPMIPTARITATE